MDGVELIVSFTSYGKRLQGEDIFVALDSIFNQTIKRKFKVVFTIFRDDQKLLTGKIKKYIDDHKIEIIIADTNLRPHLKYFYVMKKYNSIPIVTVDDDVKYEPDLLERLFNGYLKHPKCVIAARTHTIRYAPDGMPLKYNYWLYEHLNGGEPSYDAFACGVGGILYPPNILQFDEDGYKNIAKDILERMLTNDDLYLRIRETNLGIKVVSVQEKKRAYQLLDSGLDKESLCMSDNAKNNDIYLSKGYLKQEKHKIPKRYVNLAYITDEKYAYPTFVSMKSALKNKGSGTKYYVYVVCNEVGVRNLRQFKTLEREDFNVILVQKKDIPQAEEMKEVVAPVPKVSCLKFCLSSVLDTLDKCLYIDGDTLVLKDLNELFSIDLKGIYAGVVKDFKICTLNKRKMYKDLVKANNGYFNSGVILFNFNEIRKDGVEKKLFDYRVNGVNFFSDQDALNVVFGKKVKHISPRFNYIASDLLFDAKDIEEFYGEPCMPRDFNLVEKGKPVIFHITGVDKPWGEKKATSPCRKIFEKYEKMMV